MPEQPDVVDEEGFKREHDHQFERGWHVVALQRDETEEAAEEAIRLRDEVGLASSRLHAQTTRVCLLAAAATTCRYALDVRSRASLKGSQPGASLAS